MNEWLAFFLFEIITLLLLCLVNQEPRGFLVSLSMFLGPPQQFSERMLCFPRPRHVFSRWKTDLMGGKHFTILKDSVQILHGNITLYNHWGHIEST